MGTGSCCFASATAPCCPALLVHTACCQASPDMQLHSPAHAPGARLQDALHDGGDADVRVGAPAARLEPGGAAPAGAQRGAVVPHPAVPQQRCRARAPRRVLLEARQQEVLHVRADRLRQAGVLVLRPAAGTPQAHTPEQISALADKVTRGLSSETAGSRCTRVSTPPKGRRRQRARARDAPARCGTARTWAAGRSRAAARSAARLPGSRRTRCRRPRSRWSAR